MSAQTNSTQTNPAPNTDRYTDFLTAVADFEGVWGLYRNGWLIYPGADDQAFCPFFPSQDAAADWEEGAKTGYIPTAITLVELMEGVLPDLAKNNVAAGIFPTRTDGPFLPSHDQLARDLITAFKASLGSK
ncbi:DUF2750 domain-containing protein [Thalassospira lucentensis]|uniref:DUF2750 domain-containing protein n=1 Tax=Thalassospira lucentensis TaxID=168935 RepID=UPI003AA8FBCA